MNNYSSAISCVQAIRLLLCILRKQRLKTLKTQGKR